MSKENFSEEKQFEEAVIQSLINNGWEETVITYPTEDELIENWARILFSNNKQRSRLNNTPLNDRETSQILDQVKKLQTPLLLNELINGESISITRENPKDILNFGKEVSLKIYDKSRENRRYQIVRQPKFRTKSDILNNRRGDLMLLIDGIPVIHIELKRSGIPVSQAYNQIEKYSHEGVFTGLFSFIQIFVAMQPEETVYFANPGNNGCFNKSFYFHWGDFDNNPINDWDTFITHFLSSHMAHNLIESYTIADTNDGVLKVMRSYQYHAAKAIANTVNTYKWEDGKQLGGYVWHTTGSGKTMTSFKAAQLIASKQDADKVLFLVDRKELGIQSLKEYRSFAKDSESVQETNDTEVLMSRLKSSDSDDILIVTSIQKLNNIAKEDIAHNGADLKSIQKKHIVIIIDECHRSTFGNMLVNIKKTFKNAVIFGFTGTPIQELNSKKDSTTSTIFGDEIHRYSLADGIKDKNVLGFDPYMVHIYDDSELREKVALEKAKAKDIYEVYGNPKKEKIYFEYMDSSKVKMYEEYENGKKVKGIESYIPEEQYKTEEYKLGVIQDIKKKWMLYSKNGKFHAIFATSSIPDAIEYYRLMVKELPHLTITAIFDPSIDNDGRASLEKEDGIVDIIEAYNARFGQKYAISSYDSFRKEVCLRLAHKKPFHYVDRDNQIDIVIVVNQLLTGFDSKFVNTLYLDKFMEYEHIIQAFSRTNRVYDMSEKPFGIIKYYRKPNTMEKNIEAAVKAYSGDVPIGLFVDKLPRNLRNMNGIFKNIEQIFKESKIYNFERLPNSEKQIVEFVKQFNKFMKHLEAAIIQGFIWDKKYYPSDNEDEDDIEVLIDEQTYLALLARYKELSSKGGRQKNQVEEVPYELDVHITEHDTGKIDDKYINDNFKKFQRLKDKDVDSKGVDDYLKRINKLIPMLSREKQVYAERLLDEIQSRKVSIDSNKEPIDYINQYERENQERKINYFCKLFGCRSDLLTDLLDKRVTEANINSQGMFMDLINTVDTEKAAEFFKQKNGDEYLEHRLPIYIEDYFRHLILSGDYDLYDNMNEGTKQVTESSVSAIKLREQDYVGRKLVSSVETKIMIDWYFNIQVVKSLIDTGCFVYIDEKLCACSYKNIERRNDGNLQLTEYAKKHPDECLLQFLVDEKTGQLFCIKLPNSENDIGYKCDANITEDIINHYGFHDEISKKMIATINGLEFSEALKKLMSPDICNCSANSLRAITGFDIRKMSNVLSCKNITKSDLVSTFLGIHIPYKVSKHLSRQTNISFDINDDNKLYDMLLHLQWSNTYKDVYDILYEYLHCALIHPPRNVKSNDMI